VKTAMPNLEELLKTGRYADFTIVAGKETFHVHRVVLAARSSYFHSLFSLPMKEDKEKIVDLSHEDSNTVYALLKFLYEASSIDFNKLDLLRLADAYQIEELVYTCIGHISKNINSENISEIYALAHKINNPILVKACKCYHKYLSV